MIGKKLKIARAAAGLSLRDLAARMDGRVTAQAIGKYERDEDMPSSGVLIALARALGVREEYLLADDELVLEGVEFRKAPKASAKEEAQIQAQTIHLLERYIAVEDLLNLRSVDWEQPRNAPYPVTDFRDADHLHPTAFYLETPTDRILRAPVLSRHELVDHGDRRGRFVVSPRKLAA